MTKSEISELEDHTGYWLRRVSNYVSHTFAGRLADKNVTVAEWALLRMLYAQKPVPPSHVAQQMGMTKGAITKLVDRLIAKSLVMRSANAEDARAQTITLTAKGKRFVPALAALADQNDKECFASLSAKDRAALRRILQSLSANLGIATIPTE